MRFFFVSACLFVACSPSVENSTSDAGPSIDYCAELKARTERCDAGTFDAANCASQLTCYQTIVRAEERNALLGCFATRACTVSDDKCVADASAKYATDPTVTSFVKGCTDRRAACSNGFADDYCGGDFGLFTDEVRAKIQACLSKPCGEIGACFDAVVVAAGCK